MRAGEIAGSRTGLHSTTPPSPDHPHHPLTRRAAIVGLLAVGFLSVASPYTDLCVQNSELSGNHLPLGPMLVMMLLVGVVNLLLRGIRKPLRLSASELMFIFCMTLVAAGIPTFGLTAYLLPAMTAPSYFAAPENDYASIFHRHFPSWLMITDRHAVRYFYEGLRHGSAVPWRVWLNPLAIWSIFVFLLYFMMICLSSLIAPRWIREEKLTFPLVQVPLEMVHTEQDGNPLWRNPLVWIGIALPALLHSLNALHYYFPSVPPLPLKAVPFGSEAIGRPWTYMNGLVYVYFSIIGLSYILPAEVSFSIWFFYFVNKLESVAADSIGMNDQYTRVAESQYVGAFIMFALFALRINWKHVRLSVQKLKGGPLESGAPDGMLSHRTALSGLAVSLALLCVWCHIVGLSVVPCLIMFAIFIITCVGLSRIVSESGVLFAKATQMMPLKVMLPVAGSTAFSAANITGIGVLQYVFMFDLKTFLMPALLNSHKVCSESRLNKRHLLWATMGSLFIGVVLSYVSVIALAYHHGALKMSSWFFVYGPRGYCDTISLALSKPTQTDSGKILAMLAGGLVTAFLQLMRTRFVWWPFHPVGYVLAYSWETTRVWFPCFVGWIFKVAIVRYGGLRGYRQARDFFFGLILGEFGIAGVWLLIDALCRVREHVVFP